jgi:hypothetical protein
MIKKEMFCYKISKWQVLGFLNAPKMIRRELKLLNKVLLTA